MASPFSCLRSDRRKVRRGQRRGESSDKRSSSEWYVGLLRKFVAWVVRLSVLGGEWIRGGHSLGFEFNTFLISTSRILEP